jgi:hypothetical protein
MPATAVLHANHLHNATPAKGALVGCTPHAGVLQREVPLSVYRRFGCRVWMHYPWRPHTHLHKFEPRGCPVDSSASRGRSSPV